LPVESSAGPSVESPGVLTQSERADALCAMALLGLGTGDAAADLVPLLEALRLYRSAGNLRGELDARILLARIHLASGSPGSVGAAREYADVALALARGTDRARDIAVAHWLLAAIDVNLGDLASAHRRLSTVTRLAVGLGDERLVSLATAQLAEVARLDRRHADAVDLARRAVPRLSRYGDPIDRARARTTLAAALAESNRLAEAGLVIAEIDTPGLHELATAYLDRAAGDRAGAARLFDVAAEALAGRYDVRDVVDALVGAISCDTENPRYRARLTGVLASGVVVLPRDVALMTGSRT
jgi:hypothetical protein